MRPWRASPLLPTMPSRARRCSWLDVIPWLGWRLGRELVKAFCWPDRSIPSDGADWLLVPSVTGLAWAPLVWPLILPGGVGTKCMPNGGPGLFKWVWTKLSVQCSESIRSRLRSIKSFDPILRNAGLLGDALNGPRCCGVPTYCASLSYPRALIKLLSMSPSIGISVVVLGVLCFDLIPNGRKGRCSNSLENRRRSLLEKLSDICFGSWAWAWVVPVGSVISLCQTEPVRTRHGNLALRFWNSFIALRPAQIGGRDGSSIKTRTHKKKHFRKNV
jgi:hypothetical protein